MLKKIFILSLFLAGLTAGCKKDQYDNGVPNVGVNFTIDINNPLYVNLAVPGGWEYVTGGYDGIILYRQSTESFLAFDRGCPYDCETNTNAIVQMQSNNLTAVCPICGSQYIISLGGIVSKGPSGLNLKQYQTYFDGVNLTVSN